MSVTSILERLSLVSVVMFVTTTANSVVIYLLPQKVATQSEMVVIITLGVNE